MDTPDKNTASKIWRFNKAGLGYSSNGYEGPYDLAMTSAGEIDASFLKVGVIQDQQGNSTIDMTNGAATMKDFVAKDTFSLIDDSDIKRVEIRHNLAEGSSVNIVAPDSSIRAETYYNPTVGTRMRLYNNSGTRCAVVSAVDSGGQFVALNASGTIIGSLSANAYGGNLDINNNSGLRVAYLQANSASGASLGLLDSLDNITILCSGDSGNVRCVSLTQTSSRKVKENITPIEDTRKILELDAVSFDYKNKALGTNKRGFIAEDVEKVLPNLVKPETETEPAALDYVGMIPYLQDIIKKQEARITALEEKIKSMEG